MKAHRARPLYRELASAIQARKNCQARAESTQETNVANSVEWFDRWSKTINKLSELLPHGSGINGYQAIDLDRSHAEKIVICTQFHHMNENGFYDGWTEHTITVTPSFTGLNLRISGSNRNDIKDYLHETFDCALSTDVAYHVYREQFPQYAMGSRWVDSCTQVFLVADKEFTLLTDAQNHAADLMEQAFYAPKVGA